MNYNKSLKGFTLFTALVSLIVISMGLLVIQHMNNAEQNYNQIIVGIKNQSEMEAIKDFLRLETFNIFNILLRTKVYDYFNSCPENNSEDCDPTDIKRNSFTVDLEKSLEEDINDFENSIFFNGAPSENDLDNPQNKFADWLANRIVSNIEDFRGSFRNKYYFRVYDPLRVNEVNNFNPIDNTIVFNVSQSSLAKSTAAAVIKAKLDDRLLLPMDCSNSECINGSFYIKADFIDIEDKYYFQMPRIFIFKQSNFSSLDDAILPRSNFKFYIPFRIFKAMYLGKKAVNDYKDDSSNKSSLENKFTGDWNENIDSFPAECPTEYQLEEGSPVKVDQLDKEKLTEEICKNIKNGLECDTDTQNDMCIEDCVAEIDLYNALICNYNAAGSDNSNLPIPQLTLKKIRKVDVYLTLKEKDPNFSFGNKNITFAFHYAFNVNEGPGEIYTCNAQLETNNNAQIVTNATCTKS